MHSTPTGASCVAERTSSPSPPKVFDLLDYLIRNKERVVSKDDLINAVARPMQR
jgi:DNA-binding winged helix-turn-helix (wHTH) protein